jgi:hypothetical protein
MKNLDQIEQFSTQIITIVEKDKISYIDAIVEFCDTNAIDIEIAAKLLSQSIIASISQEAVKNNLIEKISSLPI